MRKAFQCPTDVDSWATINDCEECENQCMPIPVLRSLWGTFLGREAQNHYHADRKALSVTQCLGCLRQAVYEKLIDYTMPPQRMIPIFVGTAVHAQIEKYSYPGVSMQRGHSTDGAEVEASINIGDGYTLRGTADYIDKKNKQIWDWKFTSFLPKEPRQGVEEQLSIYAEMFAHYNLDEANVFYISGFDYKPFPLELQEGALEKCTARALRIKAVLELDSMEAIGLLEPEGKDISYGKKTACDYCPQAIRLACQGLE
jgi:hypothetical protein